MLCLTPWPHALDGSRCFVTLRPRVQLEPQELLRTFAAPNPTINYSMHPTHLQDFIEAIRRSLDGLETLALEQNAP